MHGVLEKPARRARAIALVIDGKSDAEVAAAISTPKCSVTRQAITAFRKRHEAEISPAVAEAERLITDYAIALKVNRIAGLDQLAREIRGVIDERGMIERTTTTTEHAEIVRERFARELPAELRSVYRAAAEELAQLPRPDVHVGDINTFILELVTPHDQRSDIPRLG